MRALDPQEGGNLSGLVGKMKLLCRTDEPDLLGTILQLEEGVDRVCNGAGASSGRGEKGSEDNAQPHPVYLPLNQSRDVCVIEKRTVRDQRPVSSCRVVPEKALGEQGVHVQIDDHGFPVQLAGLLAGSLRSKIHSFSLFSRQKPELPAGGLRRR